MGKFDTQKFFVLAHTQFSAGMEVLQLIPERQQVG